MAVRRNYRINLRNYGNPPAIMVSQYDENYDLVFEVYDGVVPATGLNAYTVKLVGRQPGDDPALKYEFTGTVSGIANNILSFTIDTTMTGRAGKGTAEIVILDTTNDVKFASFNLPVYVEKAAVPDDAIDADMERAQEIADEVQDIVDTAAAEVKGEAESWAVGERDGEPVPSTDPTYHNNAKYYAEQAQDIADSIGIDATLSISGKAADAKKTGDEISSLKEDLNAYAIDANLEFLANDVGHYVKSNGTLATSGAYRVSDYIPIPPYVKSVKIGNSFTLGGTVYHLSPALCLFDANKTAITGQTGSTADYAVYAIPSTAKYLRFNQPNEGNTNVTNAVIGFWFVQTLESELNRVEGNRTEIALTFASQQVITSNYAVKAGTVYRIEASATYASTEDASRINIYSNGDNTVYEIYKNTKPYIDFVCGADGKLNFYNAGGYTGTVTFYVTANLKRSLDDDEITYYVGKNFEHYTSLTALLLDLKDDKRKKKIIIKGGDYDIYAEYKALQNAGKLPAVPDSGFDPSTGYVPYNVFVPDNTHIIGEGLVRLNYMPTTSQTTSNEAATLSPINIAGSCILENLEIYVKHGRYCIHDDPIQDPIYTGGYKIYKNVKCYKYTSDMVEGQTFGSTYCFGCGISKEMYYEFDNCYMETQSTYHKSRTLYFHDRKIVGGLTLQDKNSSRIVIKNSVFIAGSEDLAMFFGNIGAGYNTDGLAIRVDIDSCWTNGNIVSADEADSDAGTKPNSYAFKIVNTHYNQLIVRDANSKHSPLIYAEQAQDIADSIGIDATLSISGKAADAKKTGDEISDLKNTLSDLRFKTGLYGAKWDRTTNLLTRTRDAVGITTDTTNFVHKGTINANYNNPFDVIYPWSEMKVADIDLDMYRSGNYTLKQCIIAVAGDPDFTYEGSDKVFVGRYVPEFWHTKIADESGDEYLISQFARKGYKHVDEYVRGISFAVDDGNGGVTSGSDIPLTNIAVSAIHTRAKNSGFTIMDIDILDAEIMLYLVEFANMNSQSALGDGCSSCYRENDVDVISNVVVGDGVTTFDITDSAEVQYMHIGAQMDIGATRGAATYRGIIKSFEIDGSTEHITLDRELAVTDGMIASIHGFSACEFNLIEQNIGSMSGYIGVNSKNNAWYRGALLYANRYSYILGIYRQQATNHIWICPDGVDPNDYDALNANVHKDTGTALPILEAGAWQTVGANAQNIDGLSAFMATDVSSGSSASPVGDQQYVPVASNGNTVLLFGCCADFGWCCGVFSGFWLYSSGASHWAAAALPVLKKLL